ncbi:MAG: type II secretion system protein GspF [Candidatus Auribacter fodinae]|jgi:type IV pilus assembly protein PilC|uniref:General secretion pathway protein F n=1 Tax=Candidatus Auribacter fodinae TaxID=2093366 RepID=A0A3A4R027_9BACT|nr:MAG: type II secretion system protein GspF [Candidatus Auribacter fodinae]
MPKFKYVAMTNQGKEVTGTIDSENTTVAIGKLREKGLFPTSVTVEKGKGQAKTGTPGSPNQKKSMLSAEITLFTPKRVNSGLLALFTRQLATLIDAGLPLLRSLNVLRDQQKPGCLKNTLGEVTVMVEGGSSFSEALAKFPKIFTKLYVNMIKAGEAGGVLEVVLNRLAEFAEKSEKLKKKVKSAMIYPAFVITVAIAVLTFLITFIVPKFAEMFNDLELQLPWMTKFLIQISDLFKEQWYIPIAFVISFVVGIKITRRSNQGRYYIDKLLLRFPLVGMLIKKIAIARFTRTLGTLITSGVPILQALVIVKDTAGNEVIARAVEKVHDSIREGESIVEPLKVSKVFPPMVISMFEVGEETGALAEMLIKIADNYDEDVDAAVEGLTSLLEPFLIVFLAVVVGFIVIAMFMPLISLLQQL